MHCKYCNSMIMFQEGQRYCPICGAALREISPMAAPSLVQPQTRQAAPQVQQLAEEFVQPQAPQPTHAQETTYKMRWYYFLVYFGLFALAAYFLYASVSSFVGFPYTKETIYADYPDFKLIKLQNSFMYLVLAGLTIFARQSFAYKKQFAPALLYATLLLYTAYEIYQNLVSILFLANYFPDASMGENMLGQYALTFLRILITTIVILSHHLYFKKRRSVFQNE